VSRIAVVGGGISGLAAAWRILQTAPHSEVTLLEAADRFGGCLKHTELDGWAGFVGADAGAEASLNTRPETRELVADLGLEPVFPDPQQHSQLYLGGRMHPMPAGTLMGVPGDPEALRGLLTDAQVDRVAAEQVTAPVDGDVAVGEFLAARLGDAVVDAVIDPLLGGVYSGRCRTLSLAATVPALQPAARNGTSVLAEVRSVLSRRSSARGANIPGTQAPVAPPTFMSLRGGISELVGALVSRLRAGGVRLRAHTEVTGLQRREGQWELDLSVAGGRLAAVERLRADAVVLALPAFAAAPLLTDLGAAEDRAARLLGDIPYADSALVTAVLKLDGELSGSGFLVPPVEDTFIKASTYASNKWPWLAAELPPGHGVVRMSVGRFGDEHFQHLDDAELTQRALADWLAITGRSDTAVHTEVQRWSQALPQYLPGHGSAMAQLDGELTGVDDLALTGSAFDGVGIPACIARSTQQVDRLLEHLSSRSHYTERTS